MASFVGALLCVLATSAEATLDPCAVRAVASAVADSAELPAPHLPSGVIGLTSETHIERIPELHRAVQEYATATRFAVERMMREGATAAEVETFVRARHQEVKAFTSQHNRSVRIEGEGYETVAMASESYRLDVENGIHYLSRAERTPYLVSVEGGVLRDAHGAPLDTEGFAALIVMDAEGNIYIMNEDMRSRGHETGFRHASILGGGPVAFAGNITVHEGRITMLNNRSGHYRTPSSLLAQLRTELRELGYVVPSSVIHSHQQDGPSL